MDSEEDEPEKSKKRICPEKFIDDSGWSEVSKINTYAVFMGYLSMGVRGLGFLVVTWTTVVLLGGFVSTINKKDFWCLTVIVLTETGGVFNIFLKEKLGNIWNAVIGLVSASVFEVYEVDTLGEVKAVIQLVVLGIILSPLLIVYTSGLYISTAISLWRLIEHDYGNTDENANMKPALDVLYALALFQGVVYGYRVSHSPTRKKIVNTIIESGWFDDFASASVWEYMEDTMSGCEKDPTFARGRNLITYAVELMESNSPDSFLSGVRILDTIQKQMDMEQHTLIKHMIGSASPSPVLQKLLQALGTRSPCNRETRGRAAGIVKHLAGDIRLEQFPRGIQHICSLIGTFEEYRLVEPHQRDWLVEDKEHKWHPRAVYLSKSEDSRYSGDLWKGYQDLFLNGMRILRKLAADQNNVRVMSDTHNLLSKIMAPVTSDLLHNFDHHEWYRLVSGSMKVMSQLMSAPGEAGAKMRRDISGTSEVISTMNRIIKCDKCYAKRIFTQSMRILTRLYMDTQVTEDFIKLLLHEFDNVDGCFCDVAGEGLAMLSSTGRSNCMIILHGIGDVASDYLTWKLYYDNKIAILAAKILEHLCIHCNTDDKCIDKLKEAMSDMMPVMLRWILPDEATEAGTGAGAGFSSSQADIEGQHGVASKAYDMNKSAPASKKEKSPPQKKKRKKKSREHREAYLSLCVTVCETFISGDPDKARQFSAIHESSLPRKLRELVKTIIEPTADNLRILKLLSRMVISVVKPEGSSSYRKQDLESLMEALSVASENMVRVDGSFSMYSASGDGKGEGDGYGATTTNPFRSLASLVEEAKAIVSKYYKAEESEIMELSTSAKGEP